MYFFLNGIWNDDEIFYGNDDGNDSFLVYDQISFYIHLISLLHEDNDLSIVYVLIYVYYVVLIYDGNDSFLVYDPISFYIHLISLLHEDIFFLAFY